MSPSDQSDKELAKNILLGMMEKDIAILEKVDSTRAPTTQKEIIWLYKIAVKCVRGSR